MNKATIAVATFLAMSLTACTMAPAKPKGGDLSGNWVLTTTSQMGVQDSDMTVQHTGKALAGTLTSQMGSVGYTGNVDGGAVSFTFTIPAGGSDLKCDYSGTVAGDTMQGKAVFGSFGEGTFTAKRKAP
ncbi:MAG: hypothetical protein ACREUC_04700 [Steroidobacteraceae bacterium]